MARATAIAVDTGWGWSDALRIEAGKWNEGGIVRLPEVQAEAFELTVRDVNGALADGKPFIYNDFSKNDRLGFLEAGRLHVNHAPEGLKRLWIFDYKGEAGHAMLGPLRRHRIGIRLVARRA